jgi:hypothetical protein
LDEAKKGDNGRWTIAAKSPKPTTLEFKNRSVICERAKLERGTDWWVVIAVDIVCLALGEIVKS